VAAVPRKRGANDGGWPHGRPAMEAHGVITQAGRHGVEEAGDVDARGGEGGPHSILTRTNFGTSQSLSRSDRESPTDLDLSQRPATVDPTLLYACYSQCASKHFCYSRVLTSS
jgi:hypothetical protein